MNHEAQGLDLRLSVSGNPKIGDEALKHKNEGLEIKLAHVPGAQGDNSLMGRKGVRPVPIERAPALLISYYYFDRWQERQQEYRYRNWALDSGAFSAHNSGATIELRDYIDMAKRLRDSDKDLKEIFSLDVIGDHRQSMTNTRAMWKAGIEAIPTYHIGEPESVLKHLAQNYPKIALGGVAMQRGKVKLEWARQCFARVWPCRIHGFGYGSEKAIMDLPWDSVDATNWETGPCAYGRWNSFGALTVRGSSQNLRAEIEWYLRLEQRARNKFKQAYKEHKK